MVTPRVRDPPPPMMNYSEQIATPLPGLSPPGSGRWKKCCSGHIKLCLDTFCFLGLLFRGPSCGTPRRDNSVNRIEEDPNQCRGLCFFLSSKTSILLCQTSSSRTLHVVPGIRLSGLTWTCSKGTRLLEWHLFRRLRLGDETDCKEVSSLPRQHHPQYNQHVSVLGVPSVLSTGPTSSILICVHHQFGLLVFSWSVRSLERFSSPTSLSKNNEMSRKNSRLAPPSVVRSFGVESKSKGGKNLAQAKKNLYWSNHHCTRNVMFLARPKPSNLVVLVFLSVFVWVSQEKCGDIARAIKADKMPQKKSSTPPLLWVSLLLLRWKRDDPFSFEKRYKYWKSRSPSPLCSYKRNL